VFNAYHNFNLCLYIIIYFNDPPELFFSGSTALADGMKNLEIQDLNPNPTNNISYSYQLDKFTKHYLFYL